jgi:hypothetical protein
MCSANLSQSVSYPASALNIFDFQVFMATISMGVRVNSALTYLRTDEGSALYDTLDTRC